jgi:hypothetical protein
LGLQTKNEYFGLQVCAKIISYNFGPCQGVSPKNNKNNCNSRRRLLQIKFKKFCVGLAFGAKPVYNTFIGAKRYNLRIPAVSGNWKLNG